MLLPAREGNGEGKKTITVIKLGPWHENQKKPTHRFDKLQEMADGRVKRQSLSGREVKKDGGEHRESYKKGSRGWKKAGGEGKRTLEPRGASISNGENGGGRCASHRWEGISVRRPRTLGSPESWGQSGGGQRREGKPDFSKRGRGEASAHHQPLLILWAEVLGLTSLDGQELSSEGGRPNKNIKQ